MNYDSILLCYRCVHSVMPKFPRLNVSTRYPRETICEARVQYAYVLLTWHDDRRICEQPSLDAVKDPTVKILLFCIELTPLWAQGEAALSVCDYSSSRVTGVAWHASRLRISRVLHDSISTLCILHLR
jgi:hypothetical protein